MSIEIEGLPGFRAVGAFRLSDGACELTPADGAIPRWRSVYAFIHDGRIKYVGAATDLQRRMQSYVRRQTREHASTRPVHKLLRKALFGGAVTVYARAFDEEGSYYGLPIDPLLGVEAGLIRRLSPPWNRFGQSKQTVEIPVDGEGS